jgi:hypothetical protein
MKNLPDRFPLRYAIVLNEDKEDDETFFQTAQRKVLWDQLIEHLQNEPLNLKSLNFLYSSVGFSYNDVELCHIPRLTLLRTETWAETIANQIRSVMPRGSTTVSHGIAFNIGLYSYQGATEIPFFWQVHAGHEEPDFLKKTGLFSFAYYPKLQTLAKELYSQYEQIMLGKIEKWERQRLAEADIVYLTIPNSPLWAALDRGQNNGIISPHADYIDIDETKVSKSELSKRPNKISVVVAKNIKALFREEMFSLYRVASFCNNCGKALPFNYQGKYCPDNSDNQDCIRERARKRARK